MQIDRGLDRKRRMQVRATILAVVLGPESFAIALQERFRREGVI